MPRIRPTQQVSSQTVGTLIRLEGRVLWQNRMACALILMTLVTAGAAKLHSDKRSIQHTETCYVLYWEENDWVRRLKQEAVVAGARDRLNIKVVSAAELADDDGIIRYPARSHSIQLRPVEPSDENPVGWHIWYWYAGNDASALLPYIQWFQQVTHEHFNEQMTWREQTSPLHAELALLKKTVPTSFDAFTRPDRVGVGLLWMAVFFLACHLSKLSLATAVCNRTLLSFAVTPAGWQGPAAANRIFYGTLAVLMAGGVAGILKPELLKEAGFWMTTLCAALIYLGIGLTIASRCGSIASASLGTMVYLAVSGMLYAAASVLPLGWGTILPTCASPDAAIVSAFDALWNAGFTRANLHLLPALLIWAAVWQFVGWRSYRRLGQA